METLFYRNPRLFILTVIGIVISGLSAFVSLGRQEDPTITDLFASVSTVFPGADALRVEAVVTDRIEQELNEFSEIKTIESTSISGISISQITLKDSVRELDIDLIWSRVRDSLADLSADFPEGVLDPEFDSDGSGTYATIVSLTAESTVLPISITQRYANDLSDTLRRIPGTDAVSIFGEIEEEVLVELDPIRMGSLGLSISKISEIVSSSDAKLSAGRLRSQNHDFIIEVSGQIEVVDRIKQIPLLVDNGRVVKLGDIAEIQKTVKTPQEEYIFTNGSPSILVAARISEGQQVDKWMVDVREELEKFSKLLPQEIKKEIVFDQSAYTDDRLNDVMMNLAFGMIIVVLVLLVTLGIRAAFIVALVLPVVSLASLTTMNFIGLPIHQMSLTGLIVALGLLVDSAIVVTDQVKKRILEGIDRESAVRETVRRLIAPLLASTITTALSFLPMALLPGGAGDFVGAIAIAVILMLLWSFLIAMTLTVSLAGWILDNDANRGNHMFANGLQSTFLSKYFKKSIKWSLDYPLSSISLALVLPFIGFLSMPLLPAQFFPGVDRDQFHIEVELSPGSSIDKTTDITLGIDKVLNQFGGVKSVIWVVGKSAPSFYYNMISGRDREPAYSQALVTTDSIEDTDRLIPELQRILSNQFPQARVLVKGLVQGPPVKSPVEFEISGPDIKILKSLGDELRLILASVPDIIEVKTGIESSVPKVHLDIDEENLRMAGLTASEVSMQLDAALEGTTGGTMLDVDIELPVRVTVGSVTRSSLDLIENIPLVLPSSATGDRQTIPTAAIANAKYVPVYEKISRKNGIRTNSVQAYISYGVLPQEVLDRALKKIEQANFVMPHKYEMSIGGDSEERNDTLNNLIAPLGLIVVVSLAAIVLTLRSFRLAFVVVLVSGMSAGLSILSLALCNYPFGITAIIGVIGSIGVSINAAIIILSSMQRNVDSRKGNRESMTQDVISSSRHIVSTTVTTLGGFIPLIVSAGAFWPPFAVSIAGGVFLSSIISFYFVPQMFRLVYRKSNWDSARFDQRISVTPQSFICS